MSRHLQKHIQEEKEPQIEESCKGKGTNNEKFGVLLKDGLPYIPTLCPFALYELQAKSIETTVSVKY